MTVTEVWWDQI